MPTMYAVVIDNRIISAITKDSNVNPITPAQYKSATSEPRPNLEFGSCQSHDLPADEQISNLRALGYIINIVDSIAPYCAEKNPPKRSSAFGW